MHRGLRWVCPICDEQQVSKHSHLRHYNAMHQDEAPPNPDENMRYVGVFVDLPAKAKDAVIKSLKERNHVLEVLVKDFRNNLLKKLKENIHLKARLGIHAELEKLEYNNLIGCKESEEIENSIENPEEEMLKLQSIISDDSDDDNFSNFARYPENKLENDSLKHIKKSDSGASGSKL